MNIKLLWSILIDALNINKMYVVSVQFVSLTDIINMCRWVVQRHNKSYGNNIQYLIFQSYKTAVQCCENNDRCVHIEAVSSAVCNLYVYVTQMLGSVL